MSIQVAVAVTALSITTVATAITLWECIRHYNGVARLQPHDHGNIGGEPFDK